MDIRKITDDHWVSPQIDPSDIPALAEAGVTTIINNRPDHEIPPQLHSGAMRSAAEKAGLRFVDVPADNRTMGLDTVEAHGSALAESDGIVLAYCASGTRSSILWAMSQAGTLDTDAILAAAAAAGYNLEGFRPQIDALASQR